MMDKVDAVVLAGGGGDRGGRAGEGVAPYRFPGNGGLCC